jgi:Tol biopolymer transport system component
MNRHTRFGFAALFGLALLATACIPKGMRLPQSVLLGALAPKSGLIAYVGTDGNIYTIDQGGGKPTPVTNDAHLADEYRLYGLPAWSPDGKSLVFAGYSGQGQADPTETGLFVAQKDGSGLSEIYSSANFLIYYFWSPDGQRLSFLSDTPGQSLALKLISPTGGDAETLDVGQPYYWTWAPNSQALLVHVGDGSTSRARLSILQLDNPVTEHGLDIEPSLFKAPAFSPDGTQALVAGQVDGQSKLLLMDDSGALRRTVADYEGNIAFAWSPDGKRFAYIASDQGSIGVLGPIIVADAAGGEKTVTVQGDPAYAFFWSPDSRSLAYMSPHRVEPTATATPGAGTITSDGSDIVWSLSVASARNGDSRPVATFLPSDRFLQLLPYFDQYHQSATIWSPDSQNLIVSAFNQDGQPSLWVVAASGNLEPRFLTEGMVGVWSWK